MYTVLQDAQLDHLGRVLKKGRIWALNVGENFKLSSQVCLSLSFHRLSLRFRCPGAVFHCVSAVLAPPGAAFHGGSAEPGRRRAGKTSSRT